MTSKTGAAIAATRISQGGEVDRDDPRLGVSSVKSAAAFVETPSSLTSAAPPPDSLASAKEAGLRYVTDNSPGYKRRRRGKGFVYTTLKARSSVMPQSCSVSDHWSSRLHGETFGSVHSPTATFRRQVEM